MFPYFIFADETSDFGILFKEFSFAGMFLFALVWISRSLFELWIASKEKEHQYSLDAHLQASRNEAKTNRRLLKIQNDSFLETLRRISKRDEIRFSKLHDFRFEPITLLWQTIYSYYNEARSYYIPGEDFDKGVYGDDFRKARNVARSTAKKYELIFTKEEFDNIKRLMDRIDALSPYPEDDGESDPDPRDIYDQTLQDCINAYQKELPEALDVIRENFRKLLGVDKGIEI